MDAHYEEPQPTDADIVEAELVEAELVDPELVEAELIVGAAGGDGLPVLASSRTLTRVIGIPGVQAAAAAATGFVAGAATLALMRRYGLRRAAAAGVAGRPGPVPARPRSPDPVAAAGERTYLVRVRLIPTHPSREVD